MPALALERPEIPTVPGAMPPTVRTLLALDLGTRTGWAVLPRSSQIAAGVSEFRPGRFEGPLDSAIEMEVVTQKHASFPL